MIKGKLMWLRIIFLVVVIFIGVTIASLKYNASPHAIQITLTTLGLVTSVLGRMVSRGEPQKPCETPSEKKLVQSLNALVGWSLLALVLGEVIGFSVLGDLVRRGVNPTGYEVLVLMVGYPVAVLIVYLKQRAGIIRQMHSEQTGDLPPFIQPLES